MKIILSVICLLLLQYTTVSGQVINPTKALIKKADKYFEKNAYSIAAELYMEALQKEDDNSFVQLQLAECYRLLNQPEDAEYMFRKFMDYDFFVESQRSIIKYHFGLVLEQNGKYKEAREWFEKYKEEIPNDVRVNSKLASLENIALHFQDSAKYEVSMVRINSAFADYAPRLYRNGLVFVSDRKPPYIEDGIYNPDSLYFRELYFTEILENGIHTDPVLFHPELNRDYHKGPVAFYNNEKNIIYTRANKSGIGLDKFSLYLAKQAIDRDQWVSKQAYPFNGRNNVFNVMHPCLNPEGTILYFASDMPGGFGETDIYMSELDKNGKWSIPKNLGARINTPEADMFPFIGKNGILYFTSSGHGGLGGLDIFEVNINENDYQINNLGFPINSNKNDFAITFDDRGYSGYISSDRDNGEGGSDIYHFTKNIYVGGTVKDNRSSFPLGDAYVILADKNTGEIIGNTTDENGNYKIKLAIDASYSVTILKEGYISETGANISSFGNLDKTLKKTYDFSLQQNDLILKGKIKNKNSGEPIVDAYAVLNDTKALKKYIVQTMPDGSYIFKLEPDNLYQLSIEVEGFFTKQIDIDTFEPTTSTFTKNFDLKEISPNLPFLLETTTYNANKGDIAPESEKELDGLAVFLNSYPKYQIEIRVHTDAVGDDASNLSISEDRASYINYHLIKKGINPKRITTMGYGEQFPLNNCVDLKNCDESELKLNRRVEIVLSENSTYQDSSYSNGQ